MAETRRPADLEYAAVVRTVLVMKTLAGFEIEPKAWRSTVTASIVGFTRSNVCVVVAEFVA